MRLICAPPILTFLSTPSARRATKTVDEIGKQLGIFLSTPSARRATVSAAGCTRQRIYFYPRPPRGGRLRIMPSLSNIIRFLSTPSARRATPSCQKRGPERWNFYPRPPRGGRLALGVELATAALISIHALREEGDLLTDLIAHTLVISIHALREEGDSKNRDKISIFKQIIQHSARI